MKGKILSISSMNDLYDLIELQELDTVSRILVPAPKNNSYSEGDYVSIYTKVSKIENSNFGHVYPEGTIGT